MAKSTSTLGEQDLERELLRRSVGALAATQHRCADCGRSPLVGETVHVFADAVTVCELCRPLRRETSQGKALVRHSEHGHAVRIRRAGTSGG